MYIHIVGVYARYAVFEIEDGGKFNTIGEYEIYVNGSLYARTDKTVNCVFGLFPDTEYTLMVKSQSYSADAIIKTEYEFVTLDVRKFGAHGDGEADDTVYIQAAIMSCPPKSRVLISRGKYKVTSLFLKSNISIELAKDAELLADTERFAHPMLPGMIRSFDEKSEYNLGTWEGNPLEMFAGIIHGSDVENVSLYGEGVIDGCADHENWWKNEKVMVGAFRPRLFFVNRCKNVSITGLTFKNSPSWTIHPYFSENVSIVCTKINNPDNSPNTDGIDIESCKNVLVKGVRFTLGDDCIAVKSGKIYMGRKYGVASENIHIIQCLMENGHGAVTVGSEMSAGIKGLVVEDCRFVNTDRGLRIKTRRGRGDMAVIDKVRFRNIRMDGVRTPFVVNCFYFCDPDGRTEYVQTREKLPVDERTPLLSKLVFEDIDAQNCHCAGAFFYGLPERKIEEIIMRNIRISFAEDAEKSMPAMLCGISEMAKQGIYAVNVGKLVLENTEITGCEGEMLYSENVDLIVRK